MPTRIEKVSLRLNYVKEWLGLTLDLLGREKVGTLPEEEVRLLQEQADALTGLSNIVSTRYDMAKRHGASDSLELHANDLYGWMDV